MLRILTAKMARTLMRDAQESIENKRRAGLEKKLKLILTEVEEKARQGRSHVHLATGEWEPEHLSSLQGMGYQCERAGHLLRISWERDL